jgi:hypothetical protein
MAIWETTAAGVMLFSRRLAWRDRMARSAWVALVAALLFGGTSLATAKTRGAAHRNPFPPRITESALRSTGVLPTEQQCGSKCDPYGHAITPN